MTAAAASLIIAVGLVFGAAVCRLTVWARGAGEDGPRVARTYLTPLADWGLVAISGHALALMLSGDSGITAWATAAVLAGLALALRDPAPIAIPAPAGSAGAAIPAPAEPPATQPAPTAAAPLTPSVAVGANGQGQLPVPARSLT